MLKALFQFWPPFAYINFLGTVSNLAIMDTKSLSPSMIPIIMFFNFSFVSISDDYQFQFPFFLYVMRVLIIYYHSFELVIISITLSFR